MAIDPKININENQVIFKRDKGHVHDGLTSSLIDYKKYSIFDFVTYPVAPANTPRRDWEEANSNNLKSFIVNTIEQRVLNPQGIRIQANAITAREIVSGTITANELASNVILVNNVIKSKDYNGTVDVNGDITAYGNTGWAITHSGASEFNDVFVRGGIAANTGTIGNILITSTTVQSSDYDGSNGFALYSNGFADFNEVSVRGEIVALSGSIADNFTIGNSLSIGTNVSIGTGANIGANAYIGDNLFVSNYVRINGPASSNVTVTKIRGFKNLGDANADERWTLVLEGPNGTNKWEVRDDGLMTYRTQTTYSDVRLKKDIENSNLGLDFIKDLRPVSFLRNLGENSEGIEVFKDKKTYGFVAQEVKEVYEKYTDSFEGWDIEDEKDSNSYQKISYDNFIAPIVKAIQELSQRNDELEARLQALEGV